MAAAVSKATPVSLSLSLSLSPTATKLDSGGSEPRTCQQPPPLLQREKFLVCCCFGGDGGGLFWDEEEEEEKEESELGCVERGADYAVGIKGENVIGNSGDDKRIGAY